MAAGVGRALCDAQLNAGWYAGTGDAETVRSIVTFGLVVLFIAAPASFLRNDTWHAAFFLLWSAVVWGIHANLGSPLRDPTGSGAWYRLFIAMARLFLLRSGRGRQQPGCRSGFTTRRPSSPFPAGRLKLAPRLPLSPHPE
jgi:hypothetical protein